jgi:hypothetical protein
MSGPSDEYEKIVDPSSEAPLVTMKFVHAPATSKATYARVKRMVKVDRMGGSAQKKHQN